MKLSSMLALLMLCAPMQMKPPKSCEHAAPPPGTRWVCSNANACDCRLERANPEAQDEEGMSSPALSKSTEGCVACRISYFTIPAYPEAARLAHKQGVVSASLVIGADGSVEQVRVQSGDPQLADTVQSAFQQWHFQASGSSENIPVSVKFVLSDAVGGSFTGTSLLNTVVTAKAPR